MSLSRLRTLKSSRKAVKPVEPAAPRPVLSDARWQQRFLRNLDAAIELFRIDENFLEIIDMRRCVAERVNRLNYHDVLDSFNPHHLTTRNDDGSLNILPAPMPYGLGPICLMECFTPTLQMLVCRITADSNGTAFYDEHDKRMFVVKAGVIDPRLPWKEAFAGYLMACRLISSYSHISIDETDMVGVAESITVGRRKDAPWNTLDIKRV